MLKIRRHDKPAFYNCTSPERVAAKLRAALDVAPAGQRGMPWVVIGKVDDDYWARLRAALAASGLDAGPGKLVRSWTYEAETPLLAQHPDGFLAYEAALMVAWRAHDAGGMYVGTGSYDGGHHALCA